MNKSANILDGLREVGQALSLPGCQYATKTGQKQKRTHERHGMKMTFEEVKVGETFTFRGAQFQKTALSMASDERGWGNIFLVETVVECERERDVQ
jgi:hypothetical protein